MSAVIDFGGLVIVANVRHAIDEVLADTDYDFREAPGSGGSTRTSASGLRLITGTVASAAGRPTGMTT